MSDWFWEGNVQRALVGHLVDEGWTIESKTDAASRACGIDIVAVNKQRRLAVEVKGFAATTYARGPKAGQPKPTPPTLQARHWLAEALLTTLLTRARNADHEVAIVLPDIPRYRALLDEVEWALERLAIGAYLVAEDGAVTRPLDHARANRTTTRVVVPAEGVASWRALLADPARQWKSGYSAKALAHCWQGPTASRSRCVQCSPTSAYRSPTPSSFWRSPSIASRYLEARARRRLTCSRSRARLRPDLDRRRGQGHGDVRRHHRGMAGPSRCRAGPALPPARTERASAQTSRLPERAARAR